MDWVDLLLPDFGRDVVKLDVNHTLLGRTGYNIMLVCGAENINMPGVERSTITCYRTRRSTNTYWVGVRWD